MVVEFVRLFVMVEFFSMSPCVYDSHCVVVVARRAGGVLIILDSV